MLSPFLFLFSAYFTIQIIHLLSTWNYFKTLKIIIKNIDRFEPSYTKRTFTYTERNYQYYIEYNTTKESICINSKHESLKYPPYQTTIEFNTNVFSFILSPSYVLYYIYIKYKLGLI